MGNFGNAFKQGLDAFADVERARQEINSVFTDMFSQVRVASENALQLDFQNGRKKIPQKAETIIEEPSLLEKITAGLEVRKRTIVPAAEYRDYNFIRARPSSPPGSTGIEIAEYEISKLGYPVYLRYANEYESCMDKESLELGLERLLKHPDTGEKFKRVLISVRPRVRRVTEDADAEGTAETAAPKPEPAAQIPKLEPMVETASEKPEPAANAAEPEPTAGTPALNPATEPPSPEPV